MNTHYCKVGTKRPKKNNVFSLKNIENKATQLVESVSKQNATKDLDVAT